MLKQEEIALENQSSHHASQSSSGPDHNHDQKLHLVRRLDWRFLLPDPALKRVVYHGKNDPALITALKYFANYLEILNSATPTRQPFDLAVLRSQTSVHVQQAFDLLKPGGFLYWEITQTSFLSPPRIGKIADDLLRIGFGEIAAHWHRPSFRQALDIIPILDKTALEYFFAPDRGDSMKSATGRFLLRTGLLKYAMSSVSMIAVKLSGWK